MKQAWPKAKKRAAWGGMGGDSTQMGFWTESRRGHTLLNMSLNSESTRALTLTRKRTAPRQEHAVEIHYRCQSAFSTDGTQPSNRLGPAWTCIWARPKSTTNQGRRKKYIYYNEIKPLIPPVTEKEEKEEQDEDNTSLKSDSVLSKWPYISKQLSGEQKCFYFPTPLASPREGERLKIIALKGACSADAMWCPP